ncbi:CLUMA_CG006322, isoform A, partial [Clunio marinus]
TTSIDLQGPIFVHEPAHKIEFSNNTGGQIHCSGHANPYPEVEWSPPVHNHDLLKVLSNGTLVFYPFAVEKYRHDVHASVYRCKLKNLVGTIISREVHVKAVINQKFSVQVHDEYVISGNTAVLKCKVPSFVSEYVSVTEWIQNNGLHLYPNTEMGGKYSVLENGDLYITNAGPNDAHTTYECRTVHHLTGEIQMSAYPGRIIVTEPKGYVQPRINAEKQVSKNVNANGQIVLPCIAQGHPPPSYKWFKELSDQLFPIQMNDRIYMMSEGLLKISKVKIEDSGKYLCWVNNSAGEETIQITLTVTAPLSVHLQPQNQVVDVDKNAEFQCIISGFPVGKVLWMHNGKPLIADGRVEINVDPSRLVLKKVQKEDQGMYQCFISNEWEELQSTAELQLGDATPELLYWFSEQTLQPGPTVSLKCVATGHPPPQFEWKLDGFPIPESSRFLIGQYVTVHDDVISHLNISNIKVEDGGEYACIARNNIGKVGHSAQVNVYGIPFIREMPKLTWVSATDLIVKCPVAGFPIESIRWERDGHLLPVNRRQTSYSNGTLLIEQLQRSEDAGTYTCMTQNKQNQTFRRNVEIQILVPPKIMPIQSMTNMLREGMRAAISCQILEGDLPVSFRWERNGKQILGTGNEVIRRIDEYITSLLIEKITSGNSGNYTCIASNVAGSEKFTVPLTVNVPPKWLVEPKDTNVQANLDATLNCQADGYPAPTITWKKSFGKSPVDYRDFLFEPNISLQSNVRKQDLDNGMISELGISHTYRQDSGTYVCMANNAFGQDDLIIQLIVQEVPEIPKNVHLNSQQSRNIQISWNVPFSGNSPIEEYVIQYKSISDNWQKADKSHVTGSRLQATISNLQPAKAYHVRIAAENKFGSSDYSEIIQVTTLEEVPSGPPTNVKAKTQSSTEIHASWDSPEREKWNGNLLGYYVGYQLVDNLTKAADTSPDAGYFFKTVEVQSHFGGEVMLTGLKKFSAYKIIVQAYTSQGSGPTSKELIISTIEDVPSLPPENPKCDVLSSNSIYVTWSPPRKDGQNGNIRGYKIAFVAEDDYHAKEPTIVSTTNQYYTIDNARKHTNYTITVLSFTIVGDGVKTKKFHCTTYEDVPSAPQKIKAIPSSSTKIIVSWLPPKQKNGEITGYTFYMSVVEGGRDEGTHKRVLGPNVEQYESQRLQEQATYQFWVTASTKVGEGEKTNVVEVAPNNKVPARIVSFGQVINTPWKEDVSLACKKVGVPSPSTIWRQDTVPIESNSKKFIVKNGTLFIRDCQRTDEANYTCTVENTWGRDEIVYTIKVFVPPDPPSLTVVDIFSDSLMLQWSNSKNGGTLILGYVINFKKDSGDWEELQVDSKKNSHLLKNLLCGTKYQLYITAFNKIGTGLPCEIVNTQTKGLVPVQPKHSQMITNNSTTVTCWLDSWGDGGCGISYFVIECRIFGRLNWNMISNHVSSTERIFTVTDLLPATKYQLKLTAHNNAGSTTAIYDFTTLTAQGLTYNSIDHNVIEANEHSYITANRKIIIPVLLSLFILFGLIAAILIIRKKKATEQNNVLRSMQPEPSSIANIMCKNNSDLNYPVARIHNNNLNLNSIEANKYKIDGNEYIEDLCPYATFQLNKQTYSESSYSGNVYSGPYHSVRGSFVYHGNKSDSHRTKEPEYTKVRRSGSRLKSSDSQDIQYLESDNPGSTDSEVRKILTLHIPITEYDTLGSESDNEWSAKSLKKGKHKSKRENIEDTSSSSENSPTNLSTLHKQSYPSRKSARSSAIMKRHVRSSSGYSSHNEETSFSIAKYPNTYTEIGPPTRFSDNVNGDTSFEKREKTSSSPRQANDLKRLCEQQDFPHLLFFGPNSAGKKTRIMCLLRELYGPNVEKLRSETLTFTAPSGRKIEITTVASNYHIEVNPSDAGIYDRVVISDIIKQIAQTNIIDPSGQREFKVIVLSEVDELTKDAQHALRRTMEKYVATCRLILCVNSTSRVIPAIKSRCLGIGVAAPTKEEIINILNLICQKENLQLPKELAAEIASKSDRNLRRAILMLEACKVQKYPFTKTQEVPQVDWEKYLNETAHQVIQEQSPQKLAQIRERLYELLSQGIPPNVIFKGLVVNFTNSCETELKAETLKLASLYEHRMQLGSKQIYHLEAFVAHFMSLYRKYILQAAESMDFDDQF